MKMSSFTAQFCGLVLLTSPFSEAAAPFSDDGKAVLEVLESLRVDKLWIAGAIVDWRTGEPTGKPLKDKEKHTHCSQFAAAACEKLGVYILRPPEHSAVQLANAQFDWLQEKGPSFGWIPVPNGVAAQDNANQGMLVVAVCKNPDPKKSGHIAIVRPGEKNQDLIAEEGPDVMQAGGNNFVKTSLRRGFSYHPESYDEIRFFAHVPGVKSK